jgi:hypothetical protein
MSAASSAVQEVAHAHAHFCALEQSCSDPKDGRGYVSGFQRHALRL